MSKNRKTIRAKSTTFVYTSVCCGKPANKPPVVRSPEDFRENKFSECGLGHWHCSQCGNNCKVKRTKLGASNDGTTKGTGTEERATTD